MAAIEQGRYDVAKRHLAVALAEARKIGPDTPQEATTLQNLAVIAVNEKDYDTALRHLQRSLRLRKAAYGEYSHSVAKTYENLGQLHIRMGKQEEAERAFQKMLQAWEKMDDREDELVVRGHDLLAQYYAQVNRHEDAVRHHEAALEIAGRIDGLDATALASLRMRLARDYAEVKRFEEAERVYRDLIDQVERAGGATSLSAANVCIALARLYSNWGKPKEAERNYLRTLSIRRTHRGENHQDVAEVLNLLSIFYHGEKQYEKSVEYLERYLEVVARLHGENSFMYAQELANSAMYYDDVNPQRSIDQHLKALRLYESMGYDPYTTSFIVHNLAGVYVKAGRAEDAEKLCSGHLRKMKASDAEAVWYSMGGILLQRAAALRELKRPKEAEAVYEEILAREPTDYAERCNQVRCCTDYAKLLRETGRRKTAAELEARAERLKAVPPEK
jgi:tetratricopeptide (TPR) repeat protein